MNRTVKHENEKLVRLVYAGLFSAMTTLLTATLHIPVGNGYIHCGDAVIYLAASMLPLPYAVASAAIGGMFADILTGYTVYALPTFLIKAIVAASFAVVGGKTLMNKRKLPAVVVAGIVSVVGYWITAVILYDGWTAQLVGTVPGNCIQAIGSGMVYAVAAMGLQRVRKSQKA